MQTWYGKGFDGKDYIGRLETVGLKKYIVDFKGKHEVISASVKIFNPRGK